MATLTLNEGSATKWTVLLATLGKSEDEVAAALNPIVGDITDTAIDMLGSAEDTPETDLKPALAGLKVPTALINKAIRGIRNAPAPAPAPAAKVDGTKELGDDEQPTREHITSFASSMGLDSSMMMMFMTGNGGDMDLSAMMPIRIMVDGYNPKRRDMFLMIMGQVERRLGVPIVVINGDGGLNRELTTEYIEGLEEGREAAENNIYFDGEGTPHEVIRVGVDAQSIYDADPLNSSKALQKSGMGIGRVNWTGVSLEVRQVAYLAVAKTKEIDPVSDAHQAWLRDHMKAGANRLVFHGQAPRAIAEFNEAARTGSLPTLRVMLSRGPRRPEMGPRRRRTSPTDLSGVAGEFNDAPPSGIGDRLDRSRQF